LGESFYLHFVLIAPGLSCLHIQEGLSGVQISYIIPSTYLIGVFVKVTYHED